MKAEPRVIGKLSDGTELVEIYCPVCNGDRMNDLGTEYECCRCGQVFSNNYSKDTKHEDRKYPQFG